MYTIQKLEQEILQAVKTATGKKYTPSVDELGAPPDSKWGDITFPCFRLAKGLGRPPAEIASEIAPKIEPKGLISKVETRGPYINFFVDARALAAQILRETETAGEDFGKWTVGNKKQVMVEHTQPNTHKVFHVGHVRNSLLGQCLVNLERAVGYEVTAVTYHGDVGTHVATTLWGLGKFHANDEPPKTGRGVWLGKIYAEASQYLEHHEKAKEEVAELNRRLEANDRDLAKIWKTTRSWSIDEFTEIFKELGLTIDHRYYESEMEKPGKIIVADLLKRGLAKESKGAIIVPLEAYGLEVFLILKSDGTTLYSTRDLALAERKFQDWKIDRSVAVVDSRQTLYFKQLFKTLELMGFSKPMVHVPYEFVTLKEGAMSSRKGTIVSYEDLRDEMMRVASEETKKRHADWSEKKIEKIAWQISQAAMKFSMLAQDVAKVITFDIKDATSFDGFTGPYIQYTGARIASILRKAPRRGHEITKSRNHEIKPVEKELILAIARFPKVVLVAASEMRPAPLAEYLFNLSKKFAEFYETVPILKAEPVERAFRLELIGAVRTVLENGAKILGFEIPKEM